MEVRVRGKVKGKGLGLVFQPPPHPTTSAESLTAPICFDLDEVIAI